HYVLDGSANFDCPDRSEKMVNEAFGRVAKFATGLLEPDDPFHIADQEICTGELNYVGNDTAAMIPTPSELESFAQTFKAHMRSRNLHAYNSRPLLFIGNLGTTHHNFDSDMIVVETARSWVDRLKSENFISAVLHGTTNTHPDVLNRATDGCYKINVAGDFLRTLVNGLPNELKAVVTAEDTEPKRQMHLVRSDMDSMSSADEKQLERSLQAHSRSIMDNINSPELSAADFEYFRYKFYKFSDQEIDAVVDALLSQRVQLIAGNKEQLTDPNIDRVFSASLIEVSFDNKYRKIVDTLWNEGIRHFHIAVGDGRFVPRKFDGLEKISFIRSKYPAAVLHTHLMVENPHQRADGERSVIEQYATAGSNAIAVHKRAFDRPGDLRIAVELIRECGARAGLIVETSESPGESLYRSLTELELDWVVVMGVPVGFGGQIFDMSTLHRISAIRQFALRQQKPLLLEVDGGLTLEVLRHCSRAGAQMFAGWSIIRSTDNSELRRNIQNVQRLLDA
ncbi:MAG: hypothetical protein VW875_18695, partial [Planctomycetaceae bacterium]